VTSTVLLGRIKLIAATNLKQEIVQTDRRIELKYCVDPLQADQIRSWAMEHLQGDENCDPAIGNGYLVSTLYLDTPELDIFHRRGDVITGKHRIRRYGNETSLWLERKCKSNQVVRKQRCVVDEQLIAAVADLPRDSDASATVGAVPPTAIWFRDRIGKLQLAPTVAVQYLRFARVGTSSRGAVRLTIDQAICGTRADGWLVPSGLADGAALLPDSQILELKFTEHLPAIFKSLLYEFRLRGTSFSKYRTSVEMNGLFK